MELLAPAGNWDMLKTAVSCGADAVYLGLDQFNARMKADNFTLDNISDVTSYCHLFGVRVYVVINISIKESEKKMLKEYISVCDRAHIDAFIVSDLGTIPYFERYAPTIPLHASTQLAIHNVEGARIAKKLGFSRVVVARETLFCDISAIKDELGLEVEYFVHGALCVAFSGNCLLSSIISGNSGNRGRCLQPCRMRYSSSLGDSEGYLLSPRDQCMINRLDELREIGVDSLKIEGRLKSHNYVASVVSSYRYALDNNAVDSELYHDMMIAYNRGEWSEGYNFSATSRIMNPKVQGNIGLEIGKVVECGKNYIDIETKEALIDGYGVKILSKDGIELGGFALSGIKKTKRGYRIPSNTSYIVGSIMRLTSVPDIAVSKKKIPIDIRVKQDGTKIIVSATSGDTSMQCEQVFDYATNRASTTSDIMSSMAKLGDTNFVMRSFSAQYGDNLFMPKSVLNAVRRDVIARLRDEIINNYRVEKRDNLAHLGEITSNKERLIHDITIEIECEDSITKYAVDHANIVINVDEFRTKNIQSIINKILSYNKDSEILLKLPSVARGKDIDNIYAVMQELRGLTGIYADNLYAIDIANRYNLKVMGGILLNIYNTDAQNVLGLTNYVVSTELSISEMTAFSDNASVFVHGHLPLMTLTHCPVQLNTGCTCDKCAYKGRFSYSDKRETFPIRRTKNVNCIFTLMNGKLTDVSKRQNVIKKQKYISMIASTLDIDSVLRAYIEELCIDNLDNNITGGHLFRGVK